METERLEEQYISSVQPGDHLCCVYQDDPQRFAILFPYVWEGLEQAQKVLLQTAADPGEASHGLCGAAEEHAPGSARIIVSALERGQLVIQSWAQDAAAAGSRALLSSLQAESRAALAEGYPALRWAGEMAGFFSLTCDPEMLLAAEAALETPGAFENGLALCLYARAAFPPALLMDILALHPHIVAGEQLFANRRRRPAEQYLQSEREAARLDLLLNALTSRQQMEQQASQTWGLFQQQVEKQMAFLAHASQQLSDEKRQRQGVEAALRATENRYKSIFDAATDAIFIYDLSGCLLEVNQVLCDRLGYPAEALIGQPAAMIDAPELASQAAVRLALVQQFGAITFETVHAAREGELIPVEVNARLLDDGGRTVVLSVARDITERKQDELALVNANQALAEANEALQATNAALRESEAKFRSLVETSPDGVALADENGLIIEFNAASEAIYGIPAAMAIGSSVVDIYFQTAPPELDLPEVRQLMSHQIAEVNQTGQAFWLGKVMEREVFRPDGERRFTQTINFPIQSERGYMIGSVTRDFTEHRRAELELEEYRQRLEAMVAQRTAELQFEINERQLIEQELVATNAVLRESEERYRVLVNQSPISIMVAQDSHYVFVNPAGLRQLGYSDMAELAGVKPLDTIAPESREQVQKSMRNELVTSPQLLMFRRKDGSLFQSEATAVSILYESRPAVLLIAQDVTERIRYEQQLEGSLAEKEVMLREIHHRVKNNLNVIIALIDLQKATQTDPQVLQVFKELQTRAYSMSLVHESLYRSPNLAQVDFSGYLQTLVAYLDSAFGASQSAGRTPVRLITETDQVALKVETAIPCGLMVNELVTNALKYAFPPDQSVEEGIIRVSLERAGADQLALTVSDNGVGLPPGLDWKLVSTLGLQLCQVLAQQIGGELALEPSPGVTWRFTFMERKS